MPDPRDFLPMLPWEGPPVPKSAWSRTLVWRLQESMLPEFSDLLDSVQAISSLKKEIGSGHPLFSKISGTIKEALADERGGIGRTPTPESVAFKIAKSQTLTKAEEWLKVRNPQAVENALNQLKTISTLLKWYKEPGGAWLADAIDNIEGKEQVIQVYKDIETGEWKWIVSDRQRDYLRSGISQSEEDAKATAMDMWYKQPKAEPMAEVPWRDFLPPPPWEGPPPNLKEGIDYIERKIPPLPFDLGKRTARTLHLFPLMPEDPFELVKLIMKWPEPPDSEIAPFIVLLITRNFKTVHSCAGHLGHRRFNRGWVLFEEKLSQRQMEVIREFAGVYGLTGLEFKFRKIDTTDYTDMFFDPIGKPAL